MKDLKRLTEYLGALLSKLNDAEIRKLEMNIARKLRMSQKKRITEQKNPDGSRYVPRKNRIRDKRNKIKNKMFNVIKTSEYMRIARTDRGVAIGFTGRIAFIARVHQYGLKDRVNSNGPIVKYDRRELLGFTEEEIEMIESITLDFISSK